MGPLDRKARQEIRRTVSLFASVALLVGPFLPFSSIVILKESINLGYFTNHRPFVLACGAGSLVLALLGRFRWLVVPGAIAAGLILPDAVNVSRTGPLMIGTALLPIAAIAVLATGSSAFLPDPPTCAVCGARLEGGRCGVCQRGRRPRPGRSANA